MPQEPTLYLSVEYQLYIEYWIICDNSIYRLSLIVSPTCASGVDDIYCYYCEAEIVKDFIDHILQPK